MVCHFSSPGFIPLSYDDCLGGTPLHRDTQLCFPGLVTSVLGKDEE